MEIPFQNEFFPLVFFFSARDYVGAYFLADTLRHNAVFFVVGFLDTSSAFCLFYCMPHSVRDRVSIEDDMPCRMPRGASHGLYECRFRAQESFFVSVKYGHERDFRKIEPFPQQIDANDNIVRSHSQVFENVQPFKGVDF